MKRIVLIILCFSITLVSCAHVPETHYFTLSYDLPSESQDVKKPRFDTALCVRQLSITVPYDHLKIVYRLSPYEIMYYHYNLWSAKPQRLVSELIVKYLSLSGLFKSVTDYQRECKSDFILTGDIEAIEELDKEEGWYAHLSISLRLLWGEQHQVVWTHKVDLSQRVESQTPLKVVEKLSELFEEGMVEFEEKLIEFFESSPGKKK